MSFELEARVRRLEIQSIALSPTSARPVADPKVLSALVERLEAIGPESTGRWGAG